MIVFTEWKGHGPREIEDQVTYPLSLGLRGLRGVRVVRSSSDVGFSMISVIFEDGVAHPRRGGALPSGWPASRRSCPQVLVPELAPDAPATGQIFWYTVEGGGLDLGRLRAIQDWYVRPQLGSVPGVAEVSSVGGFPIEYQVAPDLDRLRVLRADAQGCCRGRRRVQRGVGRASDPQGKRRIRGARASAGWGLRARPATTRSTSRRALRDLENVVVPLAGGGTIRLAEVAEIGIGPGFRRGVLEKDGNEVTGGVVLMANGENPLEVTPAHQGEDPRAADRPAAGRSDRPVLRPHAADRGGDRHGHADRRRSDDLGVALRAGGAVARANLADHRQHDSAGCAVVVPDHGGACAGWASSTSRPTRCRWRESPSRSACWSTRRS